MKKRMLVLMVAVVLVSLSAHATVAIDWAWSRGADGGVLDSGGGSYLALGNIVQLIWSSTQTPAAINAASPLVPTSGTLLGQQLLGDSSDLLGLPGGWQYGVGNYGDPSDALVGGYVYQRVFHDLNSDGIGSDDWYANSIRAEFTQLADADPPGAAPPADASYLYTQGDYPGQADPNWLPVPEPGSMALFAIGLAALVGRGLKRKN